MYLDRYGHLPHEQSIEKSNVSSIKQKLLSHEQNGLIKKSVYILCEVRY